MFASRFVVSVFLLLTSAGVASAHRPITCADFLVTLAGVPGDKAILLTPAAPHPTLALIQSLSFEYRSLKAMARNADEDNRLAVLSPGIELFDAVDEYHRCLNQYEELRRERQRATAVALNDVLRKAEKERYRAAVAATEWLDLVWDSDADVLDSMFEPAEEPEKIAVEAPPAPVVAREVRMEFRDRDLEEFFRSDDTAANPRAAAGNFSWQRYAKVVLKHLERVNEVRSINDLRKIETDVKKYGPTAKYAGFFAIEADKQFRILFHWDEKAQHAYDVFVEDYHAE